MNSQYDEIIFDCTEFDANSDIGGRKYDQLLTSIFSHYAGKPGPKSVLACASELIAAGYQRNARL